MYFTQGGTLSAYYTTGRAYFGHPSGGFFFCKDFFMADCQLPSSFKVSGLGPGVAPGLAITSGLAFFLILACRFHRLNSQ
jgi:hypothetical protein